MKKARSWKVLTPEEQERKEREKRKRVKELAMCREKFECEKKKGTQVLMTELDKKRLTEVQEWIDRRPRNEEEHEMKRLAREELTIYLARFDYAREKRRIELEKEVEEKARIEKEEIEALFKSTYEKLKEREQNDEIELDSVVGREKKNLGRSPIGVGEKIKTPEKEVSVEAAASIKLPSGTDSESENEINLESGKDNIDETIIHDNGSKGKKEVFLESIAGSSKDKTLAEKFIEDKNINVEEKEEVIMEDAEMFLKSEQFVQDALDLQEAVVEITTSKDCRKEIGRAMRKEVRNLIEIVIKQQKMMMYYKAKYEESQKQRKIESEIESYAEKVKKGAKQVDEGRIKKKVKTNYSVSIYPVDDATSEETKREISKKVSISEIKIIKGVRNIRRGGILVEVSDKQDVEQLIKNIEENKELAEKYKATQTSKRLPQVIIFNVDEEIGEIELLREIRERNDINFEEKEIKIRKRFKGRSGNNWILELKPEIFKKLMEIRKLKIGWIQHDCKENINPTFCFSCGRPGHIAKVCKNPKICTNCGSVEHKKENCKEKVKCLNCHYSNTKWGTALDTEHSCFNRQCEFFIRELDKLSNRIDYG